MTKTRAPARRLRGPGSALALFGALAGILIWSKLRVVTEMPRSAYAVPKEARDGDRPSGSENRATRDESGTSEKDTPRADSDGPGEG